MVFSNNLLFGAAAAASSGAAPFDTTLIGNSVWLDGSADGFTKPASEFDAEDGKEFTLGTWFQLTEFGVAGALFCAGNGSGTYTSLRHAADNKIYLQTEAGSHILKTTAVFRDVAWYHILVSVDTTQAANTSRVRMFINGVETELTGTYPAENHAYDFNLASVHEVGDSYENGAFEGYLAQSFMIGTKSIQQGDFAITDFLDSFTFGTNGSQYVPKKNSDIVTLTAAGSDNSFLLDYANSSDLGNDTSGYNNDFTATSMTAANQTGSSPSSAFATWNPLRVNTQTQTFAEGNLRFSSTQTSTNPAATGNYGVSSGKFYWEVFVVAQGNTSNMLGICDVQAGLEDDTNALYASALMYSYEFAGTKRNNNSSASYGDAIATNDIVGIALDMDNGGVYFSKNGTFQASGDPTSGSSLTNAAFTGLNSAGSGVFQPYYLAYSSGDGVANFGQSPTFNGQTTAGGNTDANGRGNFKYSVPSGYKALTSANLSAPDYQGIDSFSPILYEGNGEGQRVGDFVPFTDSYTINNSAMFNEADERSFRRTPSSAGNQKTWTFSTWMKRTQANADYSLLNVTNSKEVQILLHNSPTGSIQVFFYNGSATDADIVTAGGFEDMSNWHNIVVAVDTRSNGNGGPASANDRIIIYVDGVRQTLSTSDNPSDDYDTLLNTATEHTIGQKPNGADDLQGYLADTVLIDGSQLTASSFGQVDTSTNRWVPKDVSGLTFGTNGFYLKYENSPTNIAASETGLKSDDLDVGAVSLLTDGTQYGSWNAGSNLVYQNANSTTKSWWGVDFGSGVTKTIKSATLFGNQTGDGSSAGFTSVSGAVTWTLFGSNSAQATSDNDLSSLTSLGTASVADGITKGAAVTIDASSNTTAFRYFYVQMNTTASLRRLLGEIQLYETAGGGITNDSSGQNNDLVAAGAWTSSDQFIDTPSQNFDNLGGASSGSPTISEGNTLATIAAGGKQIRSNFNLSSGKWYVEVDVQATNNSASMGLVPSRSATWANGPGRDANGGISYETDGDVYSDNVQDATAEASFAAGDVIQMAIDMNVKKVWFGKNNTFGGNPSAGTGGYSLPASILSDGAALITLGGYSGSQAATMQINYGQFLVFDGGSTTNGFKYTPPTDFNAVNQDNLDDTEDKLTAWAWIKNRDATDNHMLFDKVRGVGNDLHSNDTTVEVFNANTVQRFFQRGVQVGSDVEVNTANESYVLWQWANDGTRTANTAGAKNIFETVSTPGHFAIFDWDGNSTAGAFQHSMGGAIEMIIVKRRNVGAWNWYVWHKAIPDTKAYLLDTNDSGHTSTYWNDVAVNAANQFTLGATEGINKTGDEIISYAFRSVPGVCKVGSYTGNGDNDGPYISVGFLPRYILVRSTSGTRNWNILDTVRNPLNIASPSVLLANTTAADTAGQVGAFDILSDGFKPRDTALNTNGSGETYLYMAMADIGGNGTLPPVYGR